MKRVLLVGAHSYIAKNFEAFINMKYPLKDRIQVDKVSASNHEWENCNLQDYDSIIMLAAIVHRKEQKGMEELYHKVNCELPLKIAIRAKESGVGQFIFVSTAAVYGSKNAKITSNTSPSPETMYGKSKLQAEERLQELQTEKFRVAVIRPPKVYGPGCKGNFVRLEKLARYTVVFPEIHNKQSMIHVEKLCECMENIIIGEQSGVYLPQDKEYMDITEFIVQRRRDMGKRTILLPGMRRPIQFMMKHVTIVKKMFGDLYYE